MNPIMVVMDMRTQNSLRDINACSISLLLHDGRVITRIFIYLAPLRSYYRSKASGSVKLRRAVFAFFIL